MNSVHCVVTGEVVAVSVNETSMNRYRKEVLGESETKLQVPWYNYNDPTSWEYCYPACMAWLINEQIRMGMALIGVSAGAFLFAKREDVHYGS